jgi:hypothetical protein
VPRGPIMVNYGTQTDHIQFMTPEEIAAAKELGYKWGTRVPDRVLHDLDVIKQEEDEAVQKFKEGFLGALKNKQQQLIEQYRQGCIRENRAEWEQPARREVYASPSADYLMGSPVDHSMGNSALYPDERYIFKLFCILSN